MPKPRTPIGTHGAIWIRKVASGCFEARTRYRDWDGALRSVATFAASKSAAERALKVKLAERSVLQPSFTAITADSTFPEQVEYWLADLDLEGHLSPSTRESYEWWMRKVVLPAFQHLTLREIGVARCDALLKHLARQSYNRAKKAPLCDAPGLRPGRAARDPAAKPHRPRRTAAQAAVDA